MDHPKSMLRAAAAALALLLCGQQCCGAAPAITLSNGVKMPAIACGTGGDNNASAQTTVAAGEPTRAARAHSQPLLLAHCSALRWLAGLCPPLSQRRFTATLTKETAPQRSPPGLAISTRLPTMATKVALASRSKLPRVVAKDCFCACQCTKSIPSPHCGTQSLCLLTSLQPHSTTKIPGCGVPTQGLPPPCMENSVKKIASDLALLVRHST